MYSSICNFYVDYLIGRIEDSNKSEIYKKYSEVKEEVYRIWRVLDRISKGRSNMRDVYLLRRLSGEIKDKLNQEHNIIQEIIGTSMRKIEEHIDENICKTSQCNHLTKLTITDRCIGCVLVREPVL